MAHLLRACQWQSLPGLPPPSSHHLSILGCGYRSLSPSLSVGLDSSISCGYRSLSPSFMVGLQTLLTPTSFFSISPSTPLSIVYTLSQLFAYVLCRCTIRKGMIHNYNGGCRKHTCTICPHIALPPVNPSFNA